MNRILIDRKPCHWVNKYAAALLLAIGLAFAPSTALWAQEPASHAEFVGGLLSYVEAQGWSGQEVQALARALGRLDINEAQGADPEAVGHALDLAYDAGELEPGEQALVALQLAAVAIAMESAGLDERAVAQAAVIGARDVVSSIQEWRDNDMPIGEAVRDTLVASVRSVAQSVSERAVAAAEAGLTRAVFAVPGTDTDGTVGVQPPTR